MYAPAGERDRFFDVFLESRFIFYADFEERSDLRDFYDFWVRYALEMWCLFLTFTLVRETDLDLEREDYEAILDIIEFVVVLTDLAYFQILIGCVLIWVAVWKVMDKLWFWERFGWSILRRS